MSSQLKEDLIEKLVANQFSTCSVDFLYCYTSRFSVDRMVVLSYSIGEESTDLVVQQLRAHDQTLTVVR